MSTALQSQAAFHRATSPLFALLTPEQLRRLAELQANDSLATRIEYLAGRANEGELTEAERSEYEGYLEANDLLAIIQSEARSRLVKGEIERSIR